LFEHLNNLNIWELSEKGIGSLVKGFVPINLVILLKDMKLDNLDLLLSDIISKSIKSFKFFVWEYHNKPRLN
jgi:carbon monoxide dehydrogenase subunit G